MLVTCPDPGAGNNPEAFGVGPELRPEHVGNPGSMGVMICLGQGGRHSLSALSSLGYNYFLFAVQIAHVAQPMLFKWARQLGQSG